MHPAISPILALIAGIIIFIAPGTLNLVVAIYLIVTGIMGLMGKKPPIK